MARPTIIKLYQIQEELSSNFDSDSSFPTDSVFMQELTSKDNFDKRQKAIFMELMEEVMHMIEIRPNNADFFKNVFFEEIFQINESHKIIKILKKILKYMTQSADFIFGLHFLLDYCLKHNIITKEYVLLAFSKITSPEVHGILQYLMQDINPIMDISTLIWITRPLNLAFMNLEHWASVDMFNAIKSDNVEYFRHRTKDYFDNQFCPVDMGLPLYMPTSFLQYAIFYNAKNVINFFVNEWNFSLEGSIKFEIMAGRESAEEMFSKYSPNSTELKEILEICIHYKRKDVIDYIEEHYPDVSLTELEKIKFYLKYNNFELFSDFAEGGETTYLMLKSIFRDNYVELLPIVVEYSRKIIRDYLVEIRAITADMLEYKFDPPINEFQGFIDIKRLSNIQ